MVMAALPVGMDLKKYHCVFVCVCVQGPTWECWDRDGDWGRLGRLQEGMQSTDGFLRVSQPDFWMGVDDTEPDQ